MTVALAELPPPRIIEELSFELIRAEMLADFIGRDPSFTAIVESDPAIKVIEAAAYREMLLRQFINEAVRANFLAFAQGTDIAHLARFDDVFRLPGESDDRFEVRVILAIQWRSTGGTEPRYRSIALGADLRVADASVYRIGKNPTLHVAVFSADNGGVADPQLLAKVNAALQAPGVIMANDTIVVAPAARTLTNIVANVVLLPDAPESTLDTMKLVLRAAWQAAMTLGRDPTRSWLVSKLMISGVHSVDILQPHVDVSVSSNEAAALGTITLHNIGRAF